MNEDQEKASKELKQLALSYSQTCIKINELKKDLNDLQRLRREQGEKLIATHYETKELLGRISDTLVINRWNEVYIIEINEEDDIAFRTEILI